MYSFKAIISLKTVLVFVSKIIENTFLAIEILQIQILFKTISYRLPWLMA